MNKIVSALSAIILLIVLSSCETCMDCRVAYDMPSGERKIDDLSQMCGTNSELDDEEENLEESYRDFGNVSVDCSRR